MTQRREEMAILRVLDASSASSPETVFFEEMVAGWQSQRLSRNLSFATVEAGARVVTRFADAVGAPPWRWTTESWERWVSMLRERDGLARSTVRSYGLTVASFLTYACDPAYGWSSRCLEQFGHPPVQICRPENLATHRTDTEASPSRRPLTKAECQALFDAADDRAASVRAKRRQGLGAGLPGLGHVEGRLRLRSAPAGARDAGALRLHREPQGPRVRGLRRLPGAVRQGHQRLATETPGCADGDAVVGRGAGRVDRRDPAGLAAGHLEPVAVGAGRTSE